MRALKPGDVIETSPWARIAPLGVISMGVYGMLALAPALVGIGLFKDPASVTASFGTPEGQRIWLICAAVWLGALTVSIWAARMVRRRRIRIDHGRVVLHRAFGGEKIFEAREAANVEVHTSIERLGQGDVRIKYRDGSRAVIDGTGFTPEDLSRVADFIAKGVKPA